MFVKFRLISIIFVFFILLSGCDSTDINTVKERPVKSENGNMEKISQKLESYINKDVDNMSQFLITDLKNIKELSQNYFVHYTYKLDEIDYEGIAYLEKVNGEIEISRTEEVMIDNESRVTNIMATGDFNNANKRYVVTAGTVNDQGIDTILVTYVNQNNVFFKLSSTKRSFLDIQVVEIGEQEIGLEQVIGLDSDRKEIYKRNE
ncbi:hypothetical protein CXK86_23740 [Paenibacillus sp. BGI2013]|uniref:hypothetical protein n=1 Tax=Paenibacillus sp. BGI2013 TaxID=2058902 RepID=UPI000C6CFAFE|nr:hypothetical protein [Paenibacillus sp. BGI2013]PKQ88724.1 hypothetical protein CXK86_23740 [Paenibacillus sp. BGI2013]